MYLLFIIFWAFYFIKGCSRQKKKYVSPVIRTNNYNGIGVIKLSNKCIRNMEKDLYKPENVRNGVAGLACQQYKKTFHFNF